MNKVTERRMQADYLNIGGADKAEYVLCGTGFTTLTESPSAQTKSKRYINAASSRQGVSGYEWSASFEADQIKSEEALAFILDIGKGLKTGEAAEAEFVQVDLDSPATGGANTFAARKRIVAIAVSEMPDNDGELGVNGDFLGVTDPEIGTFNTTTKVFTPTVAATPTVLSGKEK